MIDSSSRLRENFWRYFFAKRQDWDSGTIATTLPYRCWIPQLLVDNICDGLSLFPLHCVCSALHNLQTGNSDKREQGCPVLYLSTRATAPALGQCLRLHFQQLSRMVSPTSLWQQWERGAHPYSKCPGLAHVCRDLCRGIKLLLLEWGVLLLGKTFLFTCSSA